MVRFQLNKSPVETAAPAQDSLLQVLAPSTRVACCSGLTLPEQSVVCHDVQTWRRRAAPSALHLPTVFGLGI